MSPQTYFNLKFQLNNDWNVDFNAFSEMVPWHLEILLVQINEYIKKKEAEMKKRQKR